MKKIILLVIFVFIMVSCNKTKGIEYVDAPTRFIVKEAYNDESLKYMSIYNVEIIDPNGLSCNRNSNNENLSFTFTDSVGKYKIGDVVNFKKIEIK